MVTWQIRPATFRSDPTNDQPTRFRTGHAVGTGAGRPSGRGVRSVSGSIGRRADGNRAASGSDALAGGALDAFQFEVHLDFFLPLDGFVSRRFELVCQRW